MGIIDGLLKSFNKESKNSKEEEINQLQDKILEISNYPFKYGKLNNVTTHYHNPYDKYNRYGYETHNYYVDDGVKFRLDFNLNIDYAFNKKTSEHRFPYNVLEIGEESYENSIIHSISLSLIIEKDDYGNMVTLDSNSIEVKRGVNPDLVDKYSDYKRGYTNGYSNLQFGNQIIIDTPVPVLKCRKSITDYREIDNLLYEILNHLKLEITKQLEKEVENLKYLEKIRKRISQFKSDITIDVVKEHFISVFDYVRDYNLSESGEGENISILLNINPFSDNEMVYHRNVYNDYSTSGIATFNLTMNSNNSNFLLELSESINRFNQYFSYICNVKLNITPSQINLFFTLNKNGQNKRD